MSRFRRLLLLLLVLLGVPPLEAQDQLRSVEPGGSQRLEAGGVARVVRSGRLREIPQGAIVTVESQPPTDPPIAASWDAEGRELLVGVPSTTEPGEYEVTLIWMNERGLKSGERFTLAVGELPALAPSPFPPVVLLNGYQLNDSLFGLGNLFNSCPISPSSADTFGLLEKQLLGLGRQVLFFDNCKECRNYSIERCGSELSRFLSLQTLTDGKLYVGDYDLIGHSMGGLIVRSYLSGKRETPGVFLPPAIHRTRKLLTLGTPHMGAETARSVGGMQASQMVPGSRFLWDLGTWNQAYDDLRGVDVLAVAGSGCNGDGLSASGDGMVSLTSAAIAFSPLVEEARTRIVPYAHSDEAKLVNWECLGSKNIAESDGESHLSWRIIRSFLLGTEEWRALGHSPLENSLLRSYGGLTTTLSSSLDTPIELQSANLSGTHSLLAGGSQAPRTFYRQWVPSGSYTLQMSTPAGLVTSTITAAPAVHRLLPIKFGPQILAVVPKSRPLGTELVLLGGERALIQGWSFGTAGSGTSVYLNGVPLTVISASDRQLEIALPYSPIGLARLSVQNATGQHTVNIMLKSPAPALLSITKTHAWDFTQGQTNAAYTVVVTNAASAGPTSSLVTVSETIPTGLSLVSMSGSGWSCSGSACSRSDQLSPGSSYPPVTVLVNVAANAPGSVVNRVTVTGGGSAMATASDNTVIRPSPQSQAPVITTLTPSSAAAGSPALTMSIAGQNLVAGAAVRWSVGTLTQTLTPSSISSTSLTVLLPASLLATAGSAQVAVINPNGQTSAALAFTISALPGIPNRYLLSQVADGAGWRTTFNLLNPSTSPVQYTLRLKDNSAQPMPVTANGQTSSVFSGTLAVGASLTLATSSPGPLSQGAAEAEASAPLVAGGIFTSQAAGRPDYEAAVPAMGPPARSVLLPFDNTGGNATGVAVTNHGDTATAVVIEFRDESGSPLNGGTLQLEPGRKTEFSLADRFPQVLGRRGSVVLSSTLPVLTALGLRFLPGGTFTSLPVHALNASGPPSARQVLSHVVDGANWQSSITLMNLDPVAATFQLRLFGENGAPAVFTLNQSTASSFTAVIPPLSAITLTTPGAAAGLTQGWAEVTSSQRVRAQVMFRHSGQGGFVFEAAVPGIEGNAAALAMPFDNTGGLQTGIALLNPGAQAAQLQMVVRHEGGAVLETKDFSLGPGEKLAFALSERAPGSAGARGLVQIRSQGGNAAALALRFNGPAFTTLPVAVLDPVSGVPR